MGASIIFSAVQDNPEHHRFELKKGSYTAYADYRLEGSTLIIPYVEAPLALRGTGAAGELMRGIMAIARQKNWKIVPVCSYAAAWIRRYPEYQDLLAD